MNGNVARLESLEIPQEKKETEDIAATDESENNRKRKLSEGKAAEDRLPDVTPPIPKEDDSTGKEIKAETKVDWDSRKKELINLIGDIPANELVSFLQQHEKRSEGANNNDGEVKDDAIQKFYTLPVISDKQIRRSIHTLIKSPTFNMLAKADNADGRIRVWSMFFVTDMPDDTYKNFTAKPKKTNGKGGGGNNNNRTPWPKNRPDFLRFVLYKENVDTTTAAKDVARRGQLNPKRGINYAGMKDKRGITTQFCSVYRIEKDQLLAVNRESVGGGGGNTTWKGSNIIKLGNFTYSTEEVRLGTLSGNRFDIVLRNVDIGDDTSAGNSSLASKQEIVQQKLEAGGNALKARGFINYFGMQRFGKFHDTHEVGIAILKGEFEGAIDIIMREKPDEYPRIAEARKQWAGRFESIDISKDESTAREAEMKCARSIIRDLGRFMNCEKSIVNSLSRKPMDYKRAFGSITKHMRSMFLHAYQSYLFNMVASHRVETGGSLEVRVGDLVLVEDLSSEKGGGGTSGLKGKSVKVVDEQDLKESKYSITDVVLPLAGSKIIYPGGSCGDLFDELLKKDGIGKDVFKRIGDIDRELSLGGDYRKLVCKPTDVTYEVITYTDPVQPLIQTDLMKVGGIDINATTICSSEELQEGKSDMASGSEEDILFGMVIGFSLPPSSYATIALRELTKRPTSSEYQGKLELSGKCERNIQSS